MGDRAAWRRARRRPRPSGRRRGHRRRVRARCRVGGDPGEARTDAARARPTLTTPSMCRSRCPYDTGVTLARSDRGCDRGPDLRWRATFVARSVRTSTTCTPPAAMESVTAGATSRAAPTSVDGQAVHRGERGEIDAVRRAEHGLEVLGQVGLREEREDPATVVVDHDERGVEPAVGAPSRPLLSCSKQRSPSSATVGPSEPAATPKTVDTKPSMPFTPRLASTWRPRRGAAKLSTSRTGMLDATTSEAPSGTAAATSRAMRPSNGSSQLSTRASMVARADASDSCHDSRHSASIAVPARRGVSASRSSSASATIRPLDRMVRIEPHRRRDRRGPGRSSASSHCIATLLVGGPPMPHDDVGAVRTGEGGAAEQRVVGRDRAGHPEVRDRVGEDRPTGGVGEAQERLRVHARAPARDARDRGGWRRSAR